MKPFIENFNGYGPLYFDEVLVYYDAPQLFTLIDNCKNSYLAMLINCCESFEYLMVNISKERLTDVKDSSLCLRDIFVNPEMNQLYKVIDRDNVFTVDIVQSHQLVESDLPDNDLYLNMLTNPELLIKEEEKKWDKVRDSLNIRIVHTNKPKEHEIDCSLLAKIISSIQNLVTAQAKCKYKNQLKPAEIVELSRLNFSSSYIGSIGIKFKSSDRKDFFNETKISPILESLSELIENATSDVLKKYFEDNNYDYKVISQYRNYLNTLIKNQLDIEYKIVTEKKEFNKYVRNFDSISQFKNLNNYILNKTFIEDFEGVLVAADTKQQTFKLQTDDRIISGAIPKSLTNCKYNVNNKVVFKIEVKQDQREIGGSLIEKFKLVDIIAQ